MLRHMAAVLCFEKEIYIKDSGVKRSAFKFILANCTKETFHISFVQFANKDYKADLLTPESYKKIIGNRDYYNTPGTKNRG